MKIALISYDTNHLKTQQLIKKLMCDSRISKIKILALPFVQREQRRVNFKHRPNMNKGVHTKTLADYNKVDFSHWDGHSLTSNDFDFFLIGGAGRLKLDFTQNIKIINVHSGIIPLVRGLDSFKWAILKNLPLGNTLHFIDDELDSGEILKIAPTPVYKCDTITSLAKRHYELEIDLLANFMDYVHEGKKSSSLVSDLNMRMKPETEIKMIKHFENWKNAHLQQFD